MSLTDPAPRTFLITGAGGGGIGSAVARRLSIRDHVILNGLPRHREALTALQREIHDKGGSASMLLADVAEPDTLAAGLAELPHVDGFVHNAAPSHEPRPVDQLTWNDWLADLSPILRGASELVRATVPGMVEVGWGRIVLVSSSAAFRGTYGRSASYAAAKAALGGLVAQLALELGPSGVTANAVAPSQILSPRALRNGRRDARSLEARATGIPRRRIGHPDDVAGLIAYLCSEDADYLTGQVIRIDGGSALAPLSTMTGAPQ